MADPWRWQLRVSHHDGSHLGRPVAPSGGHLALAVQMLTLGIAPGFAHIDRALMNAAERGHAEVVRLLIQLCTKHYPVTLRRAAKEGHIEVVKLLLPVTPTVNHNRIARIAASHGHISIVELMISLYTIDYCSVMKMAARNCHVEIVELMIALGADNYAEAREEARREGNMSISNMLGHYIP